jgi:hypothetical protein
MAGERNWKHASKHTAWGGGTGAGRIIKLGENWSGAAFVWAFSLTKAGAAVITLTNAAPGVQGVSATYDAGYVHPSTGKVVGATIIDPMISEATLEGLTYDAENDLILYYDFLVTPAGGVQRPVTYGTFTIRQGIGD